MAACEQLTAVEAALEAKDGMRAGKILEDYLYANPDDPEALHLLAQMLFDSGKGAVALSSAEKACKIDPNSIKNWYTLAAIELALGRKEQAGAAIEAGYAVDPDNPVLLALDSHRHMLAYEFKQCEAVATRSIERSDHYQARVARGFARLHQRKWGAGWDDYYHGMGHMKWRDAHDYGAPEWHGQRGRVLVYGEQGLGDQIAYCSAVDERVTQIVCHPKLKSLLARSVPQEVYGDQFATKLDWTLRADYQISMSGFMRFSRRNAEAFPKEPYLKPHPLKVVQWRAVLAQLGDRPKIGIAWTGGVLKSQGWKTRNLALAQMRPLFDLPADFISLQYNDPTAEIEAFQRDTGHKLHHYAWATQTDDLDDFAALMAGLDAVVCVPTTAEHLCGAMGIPAFVIVHAEPHFWQGTHGDESDIWSGIKYFRRPKLGDDGAVQAAKEALCASL